MWRCGDAAVLYLLSSLLAGVGAHLAYCKLLLKHTSWSYSPYGDLEMQSDEQPRVVAAAGSTGGGGNGADTSAGAPSESAEKGEGEGEAQPNFDRIPAVERMLLVFLYSVASALVGTQSVLMAKCTSQIMRLQLSGESQWGSPFAIYIVSVFALSAGFWMTRLNRGLQLFPSTFIVPMMQAMWTVLSILNGGIFFKEFDNFDRQRTIVFFSGVLVVLLSVLSLASGQAEGTDTGCSGESERDMLLGGGRTRSRSSSSGKPSSFMFSLPCVPFLMSAQAVDLGTGDSDAHRWEALNRERLQAINRSSAGDDSATICTLNAHGQYGFPGMHRRPANTDSSSSGTGGLTNTAKASDGSASDNGKGGGGGMLSWAWRVVESPRRRTQPQEEVDEVDAFFKAEGGE
eukprot:COSAG02_NODE_5713_length_4102_cov_1.953535_2_plen_401_part_00